MAVLSFGRGGLMLAWVGIGTYGAHLRKTRFGRKNAHYNLEVRAHNISPGSSFASRATKLKGSLPGTVSVHHTHEPKDRPMILDIPHTCRPLQNYQHHLEVYVEVSDSVAELKENGTTILSSTEAVTIFEASSWILGPPSLVSGSRGLGGGNQAPFGIRQMP